MKTLKGIFFIFVLFSNTAAFGQMKIGVGANYTAPSGNLSSYTKGSGGFYLEAKYGVSKKFDVGLRYSFVAFQGKEGTTASFGLGIREIQATVSYYLGNAPVVKPFIGLSAGIYNVNFSDVDSGNTGLQIPNKEDKAGLSPKIGFRAGIFNAYFAYNILLGQVSNTINMTYININFGVSVPFGSQR